ncbi:MAG: pyruvate:ferredoxin (flavodoxin) oxidoreductase [Candidatus Latescibacteria bacterium]|nr:pyruvate:ferredoxin (flavodoxin) oxidoreductase [bacterium]MBD3424436.1 pyruvate:ferredoxin (flavodoxin) oxidoreductase [Candidatus Latescibacterota bacterium]
MSRKVVTIDGNEATTHSAHKVNEVIAIYPITPSSPMGELADKWSAEGRKNMWGTVPDVVEMQSEGGASGAVHGSVQRGALTTTFTASQGLLLMMPNMFKIAGELTPALLNVSARTVATHALSIFGDHSDVMATRSTGFALLASNSVQEAMDMTLISQAATLESRVPFLHFFEGFRTSHEINKVELLSDEDFRAMIDDKLVREHRERALSPDKPFIRGTAQNPDTFFQARETVNPYYHACPQIVINVMKKFEEVVGRKYEIFQYYGHPEADRVIAIIGSGAETVQETVDYLQEKGEKVGLLKVRLYRPFSGTHFIRALPPSARIISALDRTKEPGALGEPLYEDIVTALHEEENGAAEHFESIPRVTGGRYGLSSKEFTPGMVMGAFEEMKKDKPKNHYCVGIEEDITGSSIEYEEDFVIEHEGLTRAVFYGLGSDGTVGANKNSIKIIGEGTDYYAQGYFVYDSRKAGSLTVSHLRFGPDPIHSPYLVKKADFVGCHQFAFMERLDVLKTAKDGAVFLLNSPHPSDQTWDMLPREVQQTIIDKKLEFYVIDAYSIAKEIGLGPRINTIMQTCFFKLSEVIPPEEAYDLIKKFIKKTYGSKGDKIVNMNYAAVDKAPENLHRIDVPDQPTSEREMIPPVPQEAPEYVREVIGKMIAKEGDELPSSAFAEDGSFPPGTTKWEKRNIALEIPVWDPDTCVQCGRCVLLCPHATIRSKVYDPEILSDAPESFKSTDARAKEFKGMKYTLQIAPEDCTGCGLCVRYCPAKNKEEEGKKAINMEMQPPIREQEKENWEFFLGIPYVDRDKVNQKSTRGVQFLEPLFEFSGACAGCGETPYVKLLTQLFGDRALIGNATGCSSIYGGNLPATPYTTNSEGRGVTWSNSLFEDNAEFGFGFRLALDKQRTYALELVDRLSSDIGSDLASRIKNCDQSDESGIFEQRENIEELKKKLQSMNSAEAKDLLGLADVLARKSVWILGGDGWAYDIGYGGLDHVIAQQRDVNILVLDTETYSNTGGQMSKATPMGAIAKFAAGGKRTPKKDLAMMSMVYGSVYVARVAIGANESQTIKAFREAESYDGPSLIIAYSHCIGQGYNLINGPDQQKRAVKSGAWPLLRYDPRLFEKGENPLQLDSREPSIPLEEYIYNENRYRSLKKATPEVAKKLLQHAQEDIDRRWRLYSNWASMSMKEKKEVLQGK